MSTAYDKAMKLALHPSTGEQEAVAAFLAARRVAHRVAHRLGDAPQETPLNNDRTDPSATGQHAGGGPNGGTRSNAGNVNVTMCKINGVEPGQLVRVINSLHTFASAMGLGIDIRLKSYERIDVDVKVAGNACKTREFRALAANILPRIQREDAVRTARKSDDVAGSRRYARAPRYETAA